MRIDEGHRGNCDKEVMEKPNIGKSIYKIYIMNAILPRMRYDTIEEDTAVATEEIRNHREIRLSTEKDVWSWNVSTRRGRATMAFGCVH